MESKLLNKERQRRCGPLFVRALLDIRRSNPTTQGTFQNVSTLNNTSKNLESETDKSTLNDRVQAKVKSGLGPEMSKYSRILNSKSYQKQNDHSRKYSDVDSRKFFDSSQNQRNSHHNLQENLEEKCFKVYNKSSTSVDLHDAESENYMEFNKMKHCRKVSQSNGLKITVKNDVPKSIPASTEVSQSSSLKNDMSKSIPASTEVSKSSSLEIPSKNDVSKSILASTVSTSSILCGLLNDETLTKFDTSETLFCSTVENYIPPPVDNQTRKDIETTSFSTTSSERTDIHSFQNSNSECFSDASASIERDEAYFAIPDCELFKEITNYLLTEVEQRSVSNTVAAVVVKDLNRLFKYHLEGNDIQLYGSYYSDIAISTSDVNLVMVADASIRKSFMYEVYKLLSIQLDRYHVHPFEEAISAHQTKINFSDPHTGVNCQLAYLGKYTENIRKMGEFLKSISLLDNRVKVLIIATKIWSECLYINEVEEGKLHAVGYALMVIHFLQRCEKAILPIYEMDQEKEKSLPPNDSSIGELWVAFLKFYADSFNWHQDVVTVNSRERVSKKSKGWESYWIAIEDPFSGKNIAASVIHSDVADYIKACFKSSLEYFCNPPKNLTYEANQISGNSSKWKFSFEQCTAELSDNFCDICDIQQGICEECKKKIYVQPMSSLPKITDDCLKLVKSALTGVYNKYMLSDDEVRERKQFVEILQVTVHKIYPNAKLNLFGSSANGFGFKNSDLDVCLTFNSGKIKNSTAVLKDLRFLLRKDKNFDNVIAIFNAQIPIIKFHYQPKGWRGDISLDNTLATFNSELLYTYSLVDERCKILGCALKLLAKKALIAEVTEKALSSYSYLNMVIHFLQQTDPPVLPVLQDKKFRKDGDDLDNIVENCSVWFCKDLNYILKVFKAENNTPVEQLWIDLLDYYGSFNHSQFISIRQKEPLEDRENILSARLFNIQDPFIENKNLGCVVSAKKAEETRNVINRARILFRTPLEKLSENSNDVEHHFFSTMNLTGRFQKETYCNLCGKFGHEQKNCKQSFLPLRRFNFQRFSKQNADKYRSMKYKKFINRQPYRKQI